MEYRQLGTPRFQPQQQLGGINYQAPRDLGAEKFLQSFAGLSQSLVSAGQTLNKQHIEKSLAEGEAWRKQSKKSFRDAVRDGEIHPTQNPHFAIGALRVDGERNAREATTQWLTDWGAEVANPESTYSRREGGFEEFMLEKQAAWEEENPFVSQYDSNAFYDVSLRVIDGNAVKQNAEALERDLFLTTKKRADHIFDLAFAPDLGIPYAPGIIGTSGAQVEYDAMYADGGMSPMLQEMLLEKAYLLALNTKGVNPDEIVEKIAGLTQNGASLGETELGQKMAIEYDSKMNKARNAYVAGEEELFVQMHGETIGLISEFTTMSGTAFDLWKANGSSPDEAAMLMRANNTLLAQAHFLYGKDSGKYDPKLLAELTADIGAAHADIKIALNSSGQDQEVIAQALENVATPSALHALQKSYSGTDAEFNRDLWAAMSSMSADDRDRSVSRILAVNSFTPYDLFLNDGTEPLRALINKAQDGEVVSSIPSVLLDRFESYVKAQKSGVGSNVLSGDTDVLPTTFAAAYKLMGKDLPAQEALVSAINNPTGPVLGAANRPGTRPAFNSETVVNAASEYINGWEELNPYIKQHILHNIEQEAQNKEHLFGGTKKMAYESAAQKLNLGFVVHEGHAAQVGALDKYKTDDGAVILRPEQAKGFMEHTAKGFAEVHNRQRTLPHLRNLLERNKFTKSVLQMTSGGTVSVDRAVAAQVLGSFSTGISREDMFDSLPYFDPTKEVEVDERLFRNAALTIGSALGNLGFTTVKVTTEKVKALYAADSERWNESLREFLFGDETVTLESLMLRSPEKTMNWFRGQSWWEEDTEAYPELIPDDVTVTVHPDGNATFYYEGPSGPVEALGYTVPSNVSAATMTKLADEYAAIDRDKNKVLFESNYMGKEAAEASGLTAAEKDAATEMILFELGKKAGLSDDAARTAAEAPKLNERYNSFLNGATRSTAFALSKFGEAILGDDVVRDQLRPSTAHRGNAFLRAAQAVTAFGGPLATMSAAPTQGN